MKTPLNILGKLVFVPLANLKDAFFKNVNISKFFNKTSNVIFEYSKETALIMLAGDVISTMSSHIQQRKGLEKSNRENKEILIRQEKIELGLDVILNILPPVLITKAIKKRLESGQITTRDVEEKLYKYIGPGVGAHLEELKSVDYIKSLRETAISCVEKISNGLSNHHKVPPKVQQSFHNISEACKAKITDTKNTFETPSIEKITSYYDDLGLNATETVRKKLRNGSAYDEIQGMVNGWCIIGVIAYSIVTSNIIMPILKNKISTFQRNQELKKMGETRESMKRKKRFEYTKTSINTEPNIFENISNYSSNNKSNLFTEQKVKIPENRKPKTFESFNTYSNIATQSTGLRI